VIPTLLVDGPGTLSDGLWLGDDREMHGVVLRGWDLDLLTVVLFFLANLIASCNALGLTRGPQKILGPCAVTKVAHAYRRGC
jgi:hypothetical protein